MKQKIEKLEMVNGELSLPGDKSISHRAVMFAALAEGKSEIKNLSSSEDVQSTIKCFREMGAEFEQQNKKLIVHGRGYMKLLPPKNELDCGNSGTTARLISGILAGQKFDSVLTGDKSLSSRPMKRIIDPLTQMGAVISSEVGTLPLSIKGNVELKGIEYNLPVASAQVKSAVLLAGLHAEGKTKVIESTSTRDHTENMLGLPIYKTEKYTEIISAHEYYPKPAEYFIPSDISSAAFFIVLALLQKNSNLTLTNVSLNKSRTGIIELLGQMGAKIEIIEEKKFMNETYGNLFVQSSILKNIKIGKEIIANVIDEIPILAIAGLFAEGNFEIRNADELRKKESDRINSICHNFHLLGLDVEEYDDGFSIRGSIKKSNVIFESFGDHRIAMAFAVLSSLVEGNYYVNNFESVKISNPGFIDQLKSIAG